MSGLCTRGSRTVPSSQDAPNDCGFSVTAFVVSLAHSGNFMNGTVCVLVTAVSPGPSIRPGIQQVLY